MKRKDKSPSLLFILPFIMLALATIACAQDCMGTTFSVKGYIVDAEGQPIEGASIEVGNKGSFERRTFRFNVTSDSSGFFETDSTFSYACTSFWIEVEAEGYQTQKLTYYPPSHEDIPPELPDELRIILHEEN